MLRIEASTRAQSPARLLKPAVVLRCLRPLQLVTVAERLRKWDYLRQAVELARLVAPEELGGVGPEWPEWDELFNRVIDAVENKGWFEVDWASLDADCRYAQEDPENGVGAFAAWLTYIPIKRYGFSEFDENWPEEFPQIALLRWLLTGWECGDLLEMIIEQFGITTDFSEVYVSQLQDRLATADFSGYNSPLRYLPEVARFACGETGHDLLDMAGHMEEEPPLGWTWADDLERARQAYAAAAPVWARVSEFIRWCDGPAEMQAMCDALVGPKRKRKGKRPKKINALVDILTPGVEQ